MDLTDRRVAVVAAMATWLGLSASVTAEPTPVSDPRSDGVTVAVEGHATTAPRRDRTRSRKRTAPAPRPADALAAAPPADQASGISIAPPRKSHAFANALLAIPRTIVLVALMGPRYAAGEVDDYLEDRSPNAFGRDVESTWRFGATGDWETELGPSLGVRVGYRFAARTTADAYVGLFGARGQSGGLRATLGRHTAARIEPVITLDAGRELARVFAGVGEIAGAARDPYARGPRADYDERLVAASAGAAATLGPIRIEGRGVVDWIEAGDDGDDPVSEQYAAGALVGFGEAQRATTGELAVVYDRRRAGHPWIPAGAPSTGLYVRGAVAYTAGEAERSGAFSTGRATLEARRLFDLFHGDRVLGIGVRVEAVSARADELPFDRLPALGGRDWLRAFARDEFRDRSAAAADLTYEWPLLETSRAYVFVETGSVQGALDELAASRLHVGYGGGVRFVSGAATALRLQIAGSDDGDLGFFLQLGAL